MVTPARWKHTRRLVSVHLLTGAFEMGLLIDLSLRSHRRTGATGR